MNDKHIINHRQIAWMMGVILLAGGLVSLLKALIEIAYFDAWFSEIGGIVYALLIAYAMYLLSKRFPEKNLYQISFAVAGKWGGGLINLMIILHLWLGMVRDLGVLGDFMNTTLLRRTPQEIVLYAFAIVMMYYVKTSVEVTVRVNDMVFPLFLIIVGLIPIALLNEFSFQRMQPFLSQGALVLVWSNWLSMGWFADVIVAGAFLHTIRHAIQMHVAVRHGVLLAGLGLSIIIVLILSVLGAGVSSNLVYPSYTLVEQIHITDFLDRVEIIMFSVWLPALFCKTVFIMIAIATGLSSMAGLKDHNLYAKQGVWLVLLAALVGFKGITEVFAFGNYGLPVLTTAYLTPTMLLLVLLAKFRKKGNHHKPVDHLADMETGRQKGKKGMWQWLKQVRVTTWIRVTNSLVVMSLVSLGVGVWFGPDYKMFGLIPGLFYGVCLLVAYFTSLMEMYKSNLLLQLFNKEQAKQKHQDKDKQSA